MSTGISEIKNQLEDALNRVTDSGDRVILEQDGKPVAVLISVDDLELLEMIEDREDVRAAREVIAEMKRTGEKPIPLSEVKKQLGM